MIHDWRNLAVCGDADPRIFDTEDRSPKRAALKAEQAKALCSGCPVQGNCLGERVAFEAGSSDPAYGIWGGTLPGERAYLVTLLRANQVYLKAVA